MTSHEQNTNIKHHNLSEINAAKVSADDEQFEEQTSKIAPSIDISLDDVDWAEPFELEEQDSETQDLLQEISNIDWNDDSFSENNTSSISVEDHSLGLKVDKDFSNEALKLLRVKFGLQNFRSNQKEIINAILNGYDCFVLMPTGGGKSLCYQLPALLSEGVTIVISPLIALIADQVDKLNALGIRAAHLCCTLTRHERKEILSKLYKREPEIDLLYVTPEKMLGSFGSEAALDWLYKTGKLTRFILDEVHCLSLWGHDFRPHYKQLSILKEKYNDIQIACFTATATKQVETDVNVNLKLRDVKRFVQSFNRPNIKYQVIDKYESDPDREIASLIRLKFFKKSGIVYCLSRNDCMELSAYLVIMGVAAKPYHAGLEDKIREKTQREWMQNEFDVIVATIAFGMGIDKPDVRFVIHSTIPKSMETFYQESGRAGRDGEVSYSYLFYSYDDVIRNMDLMDDDFKLKGTLEGHFDNLMQMATFACNQVDCRRYLQLLNLGETFDRRLCMQNTETVCDNCENFSTRIEANVDVTEQAKELAILVRDVTRTTDITLNDAAKIYRGSRDRSITNRRLHRFRHFGRGRSMTRLDVYRILRDLILRNVLAYHYLTTGEFPIVRIKPGPEWQTFLSSSNVVMTIPVAKRRSVRDVRLNMQYPTLSGFVRTNLFPSPFHYTINNIKNWFQETLLDLCFKYAVERGTSVRSVLHPAAVRDMLEIFPRNRDELLGIQRVTIGTINNIGEDILVISNHFRYKIQSVQRETVVESEDSDSAGNRSDFVENRSESIGNSSNSVGNRSHSVENRSDSVENRSDSVENRSDSVENRSDSVENRSDSVRNHSDSLKRSHSEAFPDQ